VRKWCTIFNQIIGSVDVVNMLRIQFERIKSSQFPTVREFTRFFGLTTDRFAPLQKGRLRHASWSNESRPGNQLAYCRRAAKRDLNPGD